MKKNKSIIAVMYALLAAVFYATSTPFSKILLNYVPFTFMAAFLYMGAGVGVGIMYLFHIDREDKTQRLTRKDLPYTIGMIVLDILAPIFLMIGISIGSASNASLLGNFEIVVLKGFLSGGGSFLIAMIKGEHLPDIKYILAAMILGFVAYGLSIFLYIRAQRDLGAAKTSAYYAMAPFVGAFLAFIVNGERLTWVYFVALVFMLIGSAYVVYDTMVKNHAHGHIHIIRHTHDGTRHTHIIEHEHEHKHFVEDEEHKHAHKSFMKSEEHRLAHLKNNGDNANE